MCPNIIADNIVRIYKTKADEVHALRGVSLQVQHAQTISIIGPSGSGKTTLLNILGGLDKPTTGIAKIGDQELQLMTPSQILKYRQKNIGHLLQGQNLFPYLTAEENIELPMLATESSQSERKKKTSSLLETVGLSHRSTHRPEELSGGEKQRVAVASALANDPPVLLADEPTGELDSANVDIIVTLLSKLSREFEKTIVLVTHDSRVASRSDIILSMHDGRITSASTPTAIPAKDSYGVGLRVRLMEIEQELKDLDLSLQTGKISPRAVADSRRSLDALRGSLTSELHRLGMIA